MCRVSEVLVVFLTCFLVSGVCGCFTFFRSPWELLFFTVLGTVALISCRTTQNGLGLTCWGNRWGGVAHVGKDIFVVVQRVSRGRSQLVVVSVVSRNNTVWSCQIIVRGKSRSFIRARQARAEAEWPAAAP